MQERKTQMRIVTAISLCMVLSGCASALNIAVGTINALEPYVDYNPNTKSTNVDDGVKRCSYQYSEWLIKIEPCKDQINGV